MKFASFSCGGGCKEIRLFKKSQGNKDKNVHSYEVRGEKVKLMKRDREREKIERERGKKRKRDRKSVCVSTRTILNFTVNTHKLIL